MDEELQQRINQLAEAIKERLIATLNLQIDCMSRAPLDELKYRVTEELIDLGIKAQTLTVGEALIFRDRLQAAYVLSEDTVPLNETPTDQGSVTGVVVSIFSKKNQRMHL